MNSTIFLAQDLDNRLASIRRLIESARVSCGRLGSKVMCVPEAESGIDITLPQVLLRACSIVTLRHC